MPLAFFQQGRISYSWMYAPLLAGLSQSTLNQTPNGAVFLIAGTVRLPGVPGSAAEILAGLGFDHSSGPRRLGHWARSNSPLAWPGRPPGRRQYPAWLGPHQCRHTLLLVAPCVPPRACCCGCPRPQPCTTRACRRQRPAQCSPAVLVDLGPGGLARRGSHHDYHPLRYKGQVGGLTSGRPHLHASG